MRRFSFSRARWHGHVGRVAPPEFLQTWLADKSSLTVKLTSACSRFHVQVMREAVGRGLGEECETMGWSRHTRLWQREVLLKCDDEPVVYARTVVPYDSLSGWPWLRHLGDNSLGSALFADPHVVRGGMRFAELRSAHPVRQAMLHVFQLQYAEPVLYARQSKFGRSRSRILVTEVFLPSLMHIET